MTSISYKNAFCAVSVYSRRENCDGTITRFDRHYWCHSIEQFFLPILCTHRKTLYLVYLFLYFFCHSTKKGNRKRALIVKNDDNNKIGRIFHCIDTVYRYLVVSNGATKKYWIDGDNNKRLSIELDLWSDT